MKTNSLTSAPRRTFLAAAALSLLSGGLLCSFSVAQTAVPVTETKATLPPRVGDTAPDFELDELKGAKVKLSTLAAQGPVVLVMLRGFPGYQCPICTAQVGSLINKAREMEQAGARVLLVYPGPADGLKAHADEFVRGKDMPANFYLALDPDFSFTRQYGLRWEAKNETSYPATFVLDSKRQVLFAKVSHSHGDRSTPDEILAALPKP